MLVLGIPPAVHRLLVVNNGTRSGLEGEAVNNPIQALQVLRNGNYDAIFLQLPLAGWTPEELIEELQRIDASIPIVVQTDEPDGSLSEGLHFVKLGVFHYLPANAATEQMNQTMATAAAHHRSRHPVPSSAEAWQKFLVGDSVPVRNVIQTVRLISKRRCTVLITGETGTGKEMAARTIHAAGNRAHIPLVAVNCSALPENLLEAELFGHVKGAFTGAINHRIGRFEQANHGTIFLDEVAEMPLDLQTKLLRVLQEREFQRLGSSDTVKVDVRVIAACNVDLHDRIRHGKFREDLFYRLNVVPILMPSLRERPRDIPLLTHHFLEKICRQESIPAKRVAPETLDRLMRYNWPGNVRQLENAVEMAIAMCGDRDTLYPGDFPLPSVVASKVSPVPLPSQIAVPDEGLDFEQIVGSIERGLLEQALRKSKGNKSLAAEMLRLKRTTLTAKLKSLEALASRAGA